MPSPTSKRRAGLDIVGQKDDAAFVGPEGTTLIFFVDRGLAFAVGGKIRELKRRLGSADHLRDHRREFLFELRMVGGRMKAQRRRPRGQADPAALEIDFRQRAGAAAAPRPITSRRSDSISRSWAEAFRPQRRDDVAEGVAAKAVQEQPATIAVPDAQARVAVASLVRETRAAAEIGAIADFPAAEHDRDIARPRIVWYSFH